MAANISWRTDKMVSKDGEEIIRYGTMVASSELIRNVETSFQWLVSDAGEFQEIAHWDQGTGGAIVSLFMLEGEGWLCGNGQRAQQLRGGQHILCRVPRTTTVCLEPGAEGRFRAIAFQFSESYLRKHCPENCPNLCRLTKTPAVATLQPLGNEVPVETAEALRELVARICDPGRPVHLQSVYRDIKIAELLVLQLEEILYGTLARPARLGMAASPGSTGFQQAQYPKLRDYELERVYQVRDMLRNFPGRSYTLVGLAHEVGTNDATLKKHFKMVIGHTVFSYLRICRMEAARTLLVTKQKTVAEIAQHLGYKHVSHFSAAFRKYYGSAPTKFVGNRGTGKKDN